MVPSVKSLDLCVQLEVRTGPGTRKESLVSKEKEGLEGVDIAVTERRFKWRKGWEDRAEE